MIKPLTFSEIAWSCDVVDDPVRPQGEGPTDIILGQDRAIQAINFGLKMSDDGYNLFVLGREGTGRRATVEKILNREAAQRDVPPDWCYYSNFSALREPLAIQLEPGLGKSFEDQMSKFVYDLNDALKTSFQSNEYRTQRQVVEEEFKEKQDQIIHEMEQAASAIDLVLMRTPLGFTFAPVKNGEVLSPEAFQQLSPEAKNEITEKIKRMETELQHALRQVPGWAQEAREKVQRLNRRTATFAVDYIIGTVREKFQGVESILSFLDDLQQDILKHVELIISIPEMPTLGPQDAILDGHPFFRRYLINLIIDQGSNDSAPVVFEDEPTFERLIGTIEHRAEMGTLQTDLHLIRPGALHRANGGYLMIEARKLLTQPMAWEALKRALLSREIRIESMARALGMMTTISLEPQPIPLDTKIILIGDRMTYTLLDTYDPDFRRLFKVAVDFEDDVKVSEETSQSYADLLQEMIRSEKLPEFDRSAINRVLQFAAREADDRQKYTLQVDSVQDLLRESAFCMTERKGKSVEALDVVAAIQAKSNRLGRIPARQREAINEGLIDIDTTGQIVGQINGLSVSQIGSIVFGRPNRITARIGLGKGEVVDIEREVELGGPIHSKGVLILSSFIRSIFGIDQPLSLRASLVFEQSYGGVDGDSASVAEACALLSAIAEVPIQQKMAITGAISQAGQVQAIGGVNEKIEGFFDVCNERGLAPGQGVIIPVANKRHLVLDERVSDAVKEGKFNIYAVSSVEEAIQILTGLDAGTRGTDGCFPERTFFGKVERRLLDFEKRRKALAAEVHEDKS